MALPVVLSVALLTGVGLCALVRGAPDGSSDRGDVEASDADVRAACSSCHLFPPPDVLPRAAWRPQIEHMAFLQGYLGDRSSGHAVRFSIDAVVAWYEARAPEALRLEPAPARRPRAPLRFRRRSIRLGAGGGPGVARVDRLEGEPTPLLASANMANGSVHLLSAAGGPRLVGEAGHPARIAVADLDRDGRRDLVIADLGDPMPSDELSGRVLAARQADDGSFSLEVLARDLGRVADALPIDADGDGDADVVVAAFGWMRNGGVSLLRNETTPRGPLRFRSEPIVARTGAVAAVPVPGFAAPGPAFAVAFAQEHELVSLFVPRAGPDPDGSSYEERMVWRAPHPCWGTSHLAETDLDADGDTDFLLANGDTLDDGIAFKPYHGVHWLENRGREGFRAHRIGGLYGAHGADAGDLDGDGDLDVVACGFLPQVELPVPPGATPIDSVVWFERQDGGWRAWPIESNHPRHTGCTLVDFDGDGRLDVVAAINRAWDVREVATGPSLEIWFNEGPDRRSGDPAPPDLGDGAAGDALQMLGSTRPPRSTGADARPRAPSRTTSQ